MNDERGDRRSDDPEATVHLRPDDDEPTMVDVEGLTRLQSPPPRGRTWEGGSAHDWLEGAPGPAAAPGPATAAPVYRAGRPRRGVRRSWAPTVLAPVVFLVAVIAVASIAVNSGILETSGPPPKPAGGAGGVSPAAKRYYKVKPGDTLSGIAAKNGTTTTRLLELNPRTSATTLSTGEKILLPPPGE